jgi:hypothetical protein
VIRNGERLQRDKGPAATPALFVCNARKMQIRRVLIFSRVHSRVHLSPVADYRRAVRFAQHFVFGS